jgi:arylsulfatase A-like enzyme
VSYYNHKTEQGDPGLYENDQIVERDGYLTDLLTDEAVDFIGRNQDQPFFLTLAYNAALPPYQPPGLPESKWDDGWDVNTATRDDYVKMVESMDDGIGKVLDTLDTLNLDDNTLVIYLYDHGGRHLVNSAPLFHGFANLWEGGIRIPAILRLPDVIPANERSAMPGIAMDLTATILDVAGLPDAAAKLDGINLLPSLRKEQPPLTRQLYWRADFYDFGKQQAIRDGQWKYIEHGNTQFLFDLNADIGERNNLFFERNDVVKRLRANLDAWQ